MKIASVKRFNPILALACTALFLLHGLLCAFFITGRLSFGPAYRLTGQILFVVLAVHAVIGIVSMAANIRLRKKSYGRPGVYAGLNASYIAQRITGIALIAFTLLHIRAFGYTDAEGYHLKVFGDLSLFLLGGLIVSAAVHVLLSLRPSLISLGVDTASRGGKIAVICFCVVICICAAVMLAAGIAYRSGF